MPIGNREPSDLLAGRIGFVAVDECGLGREPGRECDVELSGSTDLFFLLPIKNCREGQTDVTRGSATSPS